MEYKIIFMLLIFTITSIFCNRIIISNEDNIDSNILRSINHIYIKNSNISNIAYDAFKDLPNVTHLTIRDSNYEFVNSYYSSQLQKLKYISLINNNIIYLDITSFDDNEDLIYVNLSYNPLITQGLSYITGTFHTLILQYCNITVFDYNYINYLHELKKLDLSHNNIITVVGETYGYNKRLIDLDVSYNSNIANVIYKFNVLSSIKILNINYCNITNFNYTYFVHLKVLYTYGNDIH
ncbi:leucine-rich repeat protein [Alphaentomopoxvirus acuprea]|uniref:Leucine-rich repeat protein n=1 Tax=Alphaentomopoxvirus acuprea TaxID=62099 RepID=W6JPL3_9POXV|nr:leucine-rich repeat protein [Anomala cuprea entomopoxvirus]BAO49479.1 leucine-rich repeat protein [Anomala cuprea entomopoxvirus]